MLLDAGFAVLSEESGRAGDGDRIVVLDPLDGSTNASRGIPWFATSMCVVDDDGPAVALVANQATGERARGGARAGAWIGERRAASRRAADDPRRRRRRRQWATGTASGAGGSSAPSGAAALDLGLVAAGRARRLRRPERSTPTACGTTSAAC